MKTKKRIQIDLHDNVHNFLQKYAETEGWSGTKNLIERIIYDKVNELVNEKWKRLNETLEKQLKEMEQ